MYTHSSNGQPASIHFAGDGLIHGRMPARDLASNGCDIESFLFGIGSTNLVNPKPDLHPELNNLPTLDIIDRVPLILPEILVVERNQRQYPMK